MVEWRPFKALNLPIFDLRARVGSPRHLLGSGKLVVYGISPSGRDVAMAP